MKKMLFRQYRTIQVCGLRSQIFRQVGQINRGKAVALPRFFGQADGIICKQAVRFVLCGVAFILLAAGIVVSATACGNAQKAPETTTQPTTVAATTTASVPAEATQQQTHQTEQPQTAETQPEEQPQKEQDMTLQMTIGSTPVAVSWEDNEAVQALRELCQNQPLTIAMSMYGGFEQVCSIGTDLPANDVQTTTAAGDIVLYSGNQMVVFYGANTWAYTRLGHITDKTNEELTQLLSNGNVTITLTS